MRAGIVIVGTGQGGFQAAVSLRQEGFDGPITLIGAEPGLPYQRPPLSKAYLKSRDSAGLDLRPAEFYEKNGIDVIAGTRVDGIDRTVREVTTRDARFAYDHLILATGTRNLRPPIEGLDRALDLRTRADADRLHRALAGPCRCAVIGGGFIGLEFAAVARALGHQVAVAEREDRLMARVVSPEMSDRFRDKHLDLGTELHLGRTVTAATDDALVLSDGREITADLVLLAAGVAPNTELAEECGLPVAGGIVVDDQLRTSDPAISALGDCAIFPDPRTGRPVRLESVQAATDHARAIAKRLVHGSGDPYAGVPWFWSDQADWKLQIAGLAAPGDTSVLREDGTVLRFDGDILSAVETVNNARAHMMTRRLMAAGAPLSRDRLASVDYDLTALK